MVVADMQKTNKNTCLSPARCASDIFYKASAYLRIAYMMGVDRVAR